MVHSQFWVFAWPAWTKMTAKNSSTLFSQVCMHSVKKKGPFYHANYTERAPPLNGTGVLTIKKK